MSDTLPAIVEAGPPSASRVRVPVDGKTKELSAKVKAFLDLMVWKGRPWNVAAQEAGLRVDTARKALERPHVQRYIRDQKQVFRSSASGANIHRATQIRDQDENRTAAIQAIRYLDGLGDEQAQREGSRQVTPGVVVTVNVQRGAGAEPDQTVIEVNPMGHAASEAGDEGP